MTHRPDARALFLRISTSLTGFSEVDLQGTGMLDTYHAVIVRESSPANREAFFREVASILEQSGGRGEMLNALIAQRLMPVANYEGLAQNIIFMWYTGQWQPTVTNPNADPEQLRNISPAAYVQGLMWPAADTHPPGAKQPGYGSWAAKPSTT